MPFPLPARYEDILRRASSCEGVLIGPGLGRAPRTERLVRSLLEDLNVPVVLDADGINALDGHIDSLDGRKGSHHPDPPRRGVRPADRAAPAGWRTG